MFLSDILLQMMHNPIKPWLLAKLGARRASAKATAAHAQKLLRTHCLPRQKLRAMPRLVAATSLG